MPGWHIHPPSLVRPPPLPLDRPASSLRRLAMRLRWKWAALSAQMAPAEPPKRPEALWRLGFGCDRLSVFPKDSLHQCLRRFSSATPKND
jgi:hypothetical protein